MVGTAMSGDRHSHTVYDKNHHLSVNHIIMYVITSSTKCHEGR